MQTVGGRVKAAVKRDGRGEPFGQFRRVGAIGHEAAPFQFFQDAHATKANSPAADCQSPISGRTLIQQQIRVSFRQERRIYPAGC